MAEKLQQKREGMKIAIIKNSIWISIIQNVSIKMDILCLYVQIL